jgi:hypothetical protein
MTDLLDILGAFLLLALVLILLFEAACAVMQLAGVAL